MAGIAITRTDLSAGELRAASSKAPTVPAARRMLALALVLDGADRTTAARSCGMDRQTLRDWVHRYNTEGLAGLSDRKAPGRAAKLTPEQKQQMAALVEAGPDIDQDGVVRWRRVDLQARIKELFGVAMHERTVGKHLAKLGFVQLSVRPQHPKASTETQEAFKKTSPRVAEILPEPARDKPLEIWFQDEARVGQQGTLTRIWARKGTRPRAPRDQRRPSRPAASGQHRVDVAASG
jgi:transposase